MSFDESTQSTGMGVFAGSAPDEVYGDQARGLLELFAPAASQVLRSFAPRFYDTLLRSAETRATLELLTAEEFSHLQQRQTEHLAMLLAPALRAPTHQARAKWVGRVHALIGVDMMWVVDAYNLYQRELHDALNALPQRIRDPLRRTMDRRLLLDLQAQSVGYYEVDQEFEDALAGIHDVVLTARSTLDLYQGVLKALCGIDGVLIAHAGRLGLQGQFEIEAFEGARAREYIDAQLSGEYAAFRILVGDVHDDERPEARAWKTGRIVASDAYLREPALEPWRGLAARLGIRSCFGIPLVDEAGQTFALINVYSRWPGFLRGHGRKVFLRSVQQSVSQAAMRHVMGTVVPHALREHYGGLVKAGRIKMLYQPIIDLTRGRVDKVEALGRLVEQDGSLVSPAHFLPALGNRDLLRLFELGVRQACDDLRMWFRAGLEVRVSINLPPAGLGDREYQEHLFRILELTAIDPELIELEILESQEAQVAGNREAFLRDLKFLGIRLIQDDLGAGHSSLLRMESMPFDGVKVDQGLVRRAAEKDPYRAFGFIYHLTRLAHELGVGVTLEGLESPGLLEAACIIGADLGQGYAIARPLTAESLAAWVRAYRHEIDPASPRTAWGALAGYLLWERELQSLEQWPALIEEFVRAPCRVQRFLEQESTPDPALQSLLARNHAVALRGVSGRMYRLTRREIINVLVAKGRRDLSGAP